MDPAPAPLSPLRRRRRNFPTPGRSIIPALAHIDSCARRPDIDDIARRELRATMDGLIRRADAVDAEVISTATLPLTATLPQGVAL